MAAANYANFDFGVNNQGGQFALPNGQVNPINQQLQGQIQALGTPAQSASGIFGGPTTTSPSQPGTVAPNTQPWNNALTYANGTTPPPVSNWQNDPTTGQPYPNPQTVNGGYTGLAPNQSSTFGAPDAYGNGQPVNGTGTGSTDGTASPTNFGNLQDPSTWSSLTQNPTQLIQWIQQTMPGMSPQQVQYYAQQIAGSPGANPTEQAGGAQYWTQKMQQGVAGQGGGGVPSLTMPFGQGAATSDPRSNALFDNLMQRSQESLQVNSNDPIIRGQVDAYDATQQRANRNYLQQAAESNGPNANISAERRAGAEQIGSADSAFQSQLMGQELSARRQEIQSALSGAQGLLTQEQQLALQEELSQMGLAQGAYQYDTTQNYLGSPLAPSAAG